jgi:hypothetical protein
MPIRYECLFFFFFCFFFVFFLKKKEKKRKESDLKVIVKNALPLMQFYANELSTHKISKGLFRWIKKNCRVAQEELVTTVASTLSDKANP